MKVLKGQEGQNDLIFIGYQLYKDGFYHTDESKRQIHFRRMSLFLGSIALMFFTQIYFIQHMVKENESSMDTVHDVSKIEDSGLDIYKMYTYSKDPDKIPGALEFYKENDDDQFE